MAKRLPGFPISDVTVNEGAGTMTFTVTRSGPTRHVRNNSSTEDGFAVAGEDYVPPSGLLTFDDGVATKSVTEPIINDLLVAPSQTLNLPLISPTDATISDPLGVSTIVDNGTAPLSPPSTGVPSLGTNLDPASYWATNFPYIDLMRQSSDWGATLDLDSSGWVTSPGRGGGRHQPHR